MDGAGAEANDATLKFQLVTDMEILTSILHSRLPSSAHVLNMVKLHPLFLTEMSFYTLDELTEEKCWILGKYEREDTGQQFVISIPNYTVQVTEEIRQAFNTISLEILNWDAQFEFISLDHIVTLLVFDISIEHGNGTEVLPCQVYHYPREKSKDIIPIFLDNIELKSLDTESGVNYLTKNEWYCNEKTKIFREKCVKRCPSVGVYVDNEAVSGAMMNPTGHVGFTTLIQHQGKGYAVAALQHLVKYMSIETELIPCGMSYNRNIPSIKVHVKAGHEHLHNTSYFVFYKAQ